MIRRHIVSALILLALDFIWIAAYMSAEYEKMIQKIQNSPMKIQKVHAFFAYALMVFGLSTFVIPNVRRGSLIDSISYGASFGLVAYGIYDSTNAAILNKWDKQLMIKDMAWGAFVYTAAAYTGSFF